MVTRPYAPRLPLFLSLTFICAAVSAGDQAQWGQRYSRNMVSDEKNLPETFDPESGRNIKWSVPLGTRSYSTPVIAQGKVLMGTNNGRPRDPRHKGDRAVLLCLDETDGKLLWQLIVPKLENGRFLDWPEVGIVSPPTVEGDRAYLVSNRGEVLCLSQRPGRTDDPWDSRHRQSSLPSRASLGAQAAGVAGTIP